MTDVKVNDGNKEIEPRGKLKIPDAFLASNNDTPKPLPPRPKRPAPATVSDLMKKTGSETPIKTETKQSQEFQVKQESVPPTSPRMVTKKEKWSTNVNILEAPIKAETKETQVFQVKQESVPPTSPSMVTKKEKWATDVNILEAPIKTETKPRQEFQVKQESMSPKSPRIVTKKEKFTTDVNILEARKPIADTPEEELVKESESEPVEIENQDIENQDVEYEYKAIELVNREALDLFFSSPVIEQPSNQNIIINEVKENDTVPSEKIKDMTEFASQYQTNETSPKTIRNKVPDKQETSTNVAENKKIKTRTLEINSPQESIITSDNEIKQQMDEAQPVPPRPAKRSIANLMQSTNQFKTSAPKEKTKIDTAQLLERSKNALIYTKPAQRSEKNSGKIKEKDFKDRVKNFDDL